MAEGIKESGWMERMGSSRAEGLSMRGEYYGERTFFQTEGKKGGDFNALSLFLWDFGYFLVESISQR